MIYYKSNYSENRYFTPPKIDPLNIDLANLDGGGDCPAQYYGETGDGLDVYCRFRGGNLSVRIGNRPGIDCFEDGKEILDITIGPPFSGRMSIGDFCRYAGITVNGKIPMDPDREREYKKAHGDCDDLSGKTTFYDVDLGGTLKGQKRFIDRAISEFPEATFVQPIWKHGSEEYDVYLHKFEIFRDSAELKSDEFQIFFGDPPDMNELFDLFSQRGNTLSIYPNNVLVDVCVSGFEYPIIKYGNDDASRVLKLIGKKIAVAGQVDDCLHGSLSLQSSFLNEDKTRKDAISSIDALVDRCFPKYKITYINLKTGRKDPDSQYFQHLDPEVVEWINGGQDRYFDISIRGDHENPDIFGSIAEYVT